MAPRERIEGGMKRVSQDKQNVPKSNLDKQSLFCGITSALKSPCWSITLFIN